MSSGRPGVLIDGEATQHFPLLFISPSMTADSGEGGGGVAVRQEAGPTQRL